MRYFVRAKAWNAGPRDPSGQPGAYEAALMDNHQLAIPDQPLEIVLRSALTSYWDRALRAKVRHALREILTRPAPTDRGAPRQS